MLLKIEMKEIIQEVWFWWVRISLEVVGKASIAVVGVLEFPSAKTTCTIIQSVANSQEGCIEVEMNKISTSIQYGE